MTWVQYLIHDIRMAELNVHEAKTHLSRRLVRVAAGEEIVIARAGKPATRLVPIEPKTRQVIGQDDGAFEVPEDFDAPLPDEVLQEDPLLRMLDLAVDTGISDLATNVDRYLYGHPGASNGD